MRRILFALLISLTTIVVLPSPPVSAEVDRVPPRPIVHKHHVVRHRPIHALVVEAHAARISIDQLRAEWQNVAICEVGGNWAMTGSAYSGIGFLNATWSQYGGTRYAGLAGQATRDQQILIGMKVTSGWVPDQNGCSSTGW